MSDIYNPTTGASYPLTPTQQAAFNNGVALQLPLFRAAIGNVKNTTAGTNNCRILCIGDSITSGAYSGNSTGGSADWKQHCWENVLAQMFVAQGLQGRSDSFFGFKDNAHDSRLVFGSPWTTVNEMTSPGIGGDIATSTSAGTLSFTPSNPVDTFKVWYAKTPFADILGYNINGSGASTISQQGTAALSSFTTTASLGSNTLNLTYSSQNSGGGGGVYVVGIEAWNSQINSLQIINAGWNGATTTQWTNNSTPSSPGNFNNVSPNLTIISLGGNDMLPSNAIPVATTVANLQTLITTAQTTGDALLVTENPLIVASTIPLASQALYWNAVLGLANTNNIPVVDIFDRWVSYELRNPQGYYTSGAFPIDLHPSGLGYADYAQAIFNVIGNV